MGKAWQTRLRKLSQRKWRLRFQEAVLEGVRLVETALEQQVPLCGVWYSPELLSRPGGEDLLRKLGGAGLSPVPVTRGELGQVASVETSQGIIAVMGIVEPPLATGGDLWLVADGIQDPGNLGTIIRSAAAAGVDGMFLLPGTVDLYNPKTLRAAMGAAFQIPVHSVTSFADQVLPYLHQQQAALVVADIEGHLAPPEVTMTRPLALVVGNEGWGPSLAIKKCAHYGIRIPMPGGAESLNVAMAATVLLYEAVRQRCLYAES